MDIRLKRAGINDATLIWNMQREAFQDLLFKYQDYDTNPGNEPVDKVIDRINQEVTFFYFIFVDEKVVGAIRVVDTKENDTHKRISPLFIRKQYRNQGIAQNAIKLAEEIHGKDHWRLDTILEEKGNCYLYEKMGYHATGKIEKVNDKLTLVYYEK